MKVLAEFTDHMSTITGLLEFNTRLISCGIDKNIVVYDIVKKVHSIQRPVEPETSFWSCFVTKPKQVKRQAEVFYTYSYLKHNTILNAHNS